MKKFLGIIFIFLISACSNPEEEAKKLGFSNASEMASIQKEGFKTKEEWSKKIEDDKKKQEDAKKLDLQKRLVGYAQQCYSSTRLTTAANVAASTANAEGLVIMTFALKNILLDSYKKEGMTSESASLKIDELYNSYKPSKLTSGDEQTDIGKALLAEHLKSSDECAKVLKTDEEIKNEISTTIGNLSKENSGRDQNQNNSVTQQQQSSGKDPKKAADELQIAGVSRCIAVVTVMSAGLASDPKIKSDGPEIRNNSKLMDFYGAARKHLIQSMNNPGTVGAIDNMVRQQADYFGNIIKFQGWANFMPEYKQCQSNTI